MWTHVTQELAEGKLDYQQRFPECLHVRETHDHFLGPEKNSVSIAVLESVTST